jgi:hypothetical protein
MINKNYNIICDCFLTIIIGFSIVWLVYYFTPINNFIFYNQRKEELV